MASFSRVNEQKAAVADLLHVEQSLAEFYDIPKVACSIGKNPIVFGHGNGKCLERVTERNYAISKVGSKYSLNVEDFEEFKTDVELMEVADAPKTARRLFVGLGVAGVAVRELWGRTDVAPFKRKRHMDAVKEYLADKNDISEMLGDVFDSPENNGRSFMISDLTDERVMSINGLRLRLRTLMDATGMEDFVGAEYADIVLGARKEIMGLYERDAGFYGDAVVIALGQPAEEGDKMFFNARSDFLIAAATPLRPEKARHLMSPAWSKD